MKRTEHPMEALRDFLPEGSFEPVTEYINQYKVHLTVTKARRSVLGDYRHAFHGANHRITVNGNLNKFEFLITLLHELSHLLTFEQFGNRVDSHGKEWKTTYSRLLIDFVHRRIFPPEIEKALQRSIINPSATANGETELLLVLRKYERKADDVLLLQELPAGNFFTTRDGRVFQKGEKLRKRFRCKEVKTGLDYLFSPIYEVKAVENIQ
jgi:SprT protein